MEHFGEILRKARESRGITLDKAADGTKLRRDVLRALEEDAPQRLASPSYAPIFRRSYARYLGVDLSDAQARMPREEADLSGAVSGVEHEAVRRHPALASLPLSGAGIAVFILAGLLVAAVVLMRGDRRAPPAEVDPGHPAPADPTLAVEPPASLVVRASGDVHLRVERGQTVVWDGFLAAGDRRRFDAAGPAKLIVSQPSAVSIFAGGRRIELPGTGPAVLDWPPSGAVAP